MMDLLNNLHHFRKIVVVPMKEVPLGALLISCGFREETSRNYDWHGLKRGRGEYCLFQYTLAGEGRLFFRGKTLRVQPGQAMLLYFPQDHRYWLPKDQDKWEFIYVCLYGNEIMRLWRALQRKLGAVFQLSPHSPAVCRAIEICHVAHGNNLRFPSESSRHAYELAMALLSEVDHPKGGGQTEVDFQEVKAFCQANLQRQIGVEEMASRSGYSRYHFTRLFRESEGISPGQYLLHLRLRRALHMLSETSISVKEAAYSSGFTDVNYFCRAFRKAFGITPGNCRKAATR